MIVMIHYLENSDIFKFYSSFSGGEISDTAHSKLRR